MTLRSIAIKANNQYEWSLTLHSHPRASAVRNSNGEGICGDALQIEYHTPNGITPSPATIPWIRVEQIPALIKALTDIWFDAEHQTVDNSPEPEPAIKSQED